MPSYKTLVFITFTYSLATLLALIMEQAYLGQAEVDLANQLTGYSVSEISGTGIIALAKIGTAFLTDGLPKVVTWDYAFFAGEWTLFRWVLLVALSGPMVFTLSMAFISSVFGVFSKFVG